VSLGYRLGHIKSEPRVFRAILYNKSAAVLHMLRRLVGDDTFFSALQRFYTEQKFQKANTDALRLVFEAESGMSLGRFFDRWIHGATLPRIRHSSVISAGSVVMRFEQTTEQVFDLPVTVTMTYADRRTENVVVPITERTVERTIPTTGVVRRVQVNRDYAAVAHFDAR
jgi:aminopeptidase N